MGTGGPSTPSTPTNNIINSFSPFIPKKIGDPYEIRTRVAGVRGRSLRPLDQRATYLMDRLKEYGAPSGTRTLDTLIKSQVLYQLS